MDRPLSRTRLNGLIRGMARLLGAAAALAAMGQPDSFWGKAMNPGHLHWSLDLALGDTEVDEAHLELVDLYNRIVWACENHGAVENLRERIRTFLGYARWHFGQEEEFMNRLHYPAYVEHKADHQKLLQDAEDFVESFNGALRSEDGPAVASYFKYWLSRHMAEKDGTLRTFMKTTRDVTEPKSAAGR